MSAPPTNQGAASTPYLAIGGEAALRRLVHRFYELMDHLPEAYGIRKMHPADLSGSEEKLFMYLSGWLGGPPLFVQKFGEPFLRARHLNFRIASSEASQWMLCMRQALEEVVADADLRAALEKKLTDLAAHMRNAADAR